MTTFAFFDIDDTIITTKSMLEFIEYYYLNCRFIPDTERKDGIDQFIYEFQEYHEQKKPREFMNRMYYKKYKGANVAEVERLAGEWWQTALKKRGDALFVSSSLREMKKHRALGHEIVLVSGSFMELAVQVGEYLKVHHYLCTQMERLQNVYTGEIVGRVHIGDGKQAAMEEFLKKNNADPDECYAYGDHISDFSMLKFVGHPRVIPVDPQLIDAAKELGWEILEKN